MRTKVLVVIFSTLVLLGIALAVWLAFPSAAKAATGTPTVIDWSKGWAQETSESCGDFAFRNMEDRHSYSLYVRGKASGTCSFHEEGLSFHMPPNHGGTTPGTTTFYSFQRFGADVLVAWTPGY